MYTYDFILKNGFLVDYKNAFAKYSDIAIKAGKIVEIASNISLQNVRDVLDLEGQLVVPGIVDPHVHLSTWLGGRTGHRMLARAGVTTALDMSGPGEGVMDIAREYGVGLNVATIEFVRPGYTVESENPSATELTALIKKVLNHGSLGIKLLGGHYPLTPEATRLAIEIAAKEEAYVAFHAGTKATGSNLNGFLEAIELASNNPLHLAHINAYLRGTIKPCLEEVNIALQVLKEHPNITSEAYLSPLNGTSALCEAGLPASMVTRRCLVTGGYEATEAGMEQAILSGWAKVQVERAGEMILVCGEEGVRKWREEGDVGVSFAVNPAEPRYCLATAKDDKNNFVVGSISTDGGGIPRNVIIPMGLNLVEMQALTLQELVQKTSYNPARMLGLENKGVLEAGYDADITVINREQRQAVLTMVQGKLSMYKGYICGSGTNLITTAAGAEYVRSKGLNPVIINYTDTMVYKNAH
ncbi:MAG: dihydroorotase family protein [Acidaminococcaceae bacterium]|nr:dihydroorotase family protein [Acidaminococcaceae bacterium]